MQTTENLGLRKPEAGDFYNVEDMNYNSDVLDAKLKEIEDASDPQALGQHTNDKENPHGVTKTQVGLGNVPNVATNDQTPTYTVPSEMAELSSGEKLGVAMGKIAKAVKSLIAHIVDGTIHVTSSEKSAWNAKANGTHKHTKSEITDFPSTMTPSAHNQGASTITAGTLGGKVNANATAMATFTNAQVRDILIYPKTSEPTEGASAGSLAKGTIAFVRK